MKASTRRTWRWTLRAGGLIVALIATPPAHAQSAAPPLATATAPLVFRGVTVIDVRDGRLLPNQTVVIVGRQIQTVDAAATVRVPTGARVVDARGKFLIPGLWDMHYHTDSTAPMLQYPMLIANGVTGIRSPAPSHMDMQSATVDRQPREWQRDVAAGTQVGPRQPQQIWAWQSRASGLDSTATPETVRRGLDSIKAGGGEFLKFSCRGGMGSTDNCTPAVYFAVLAAARRNDLHAVGHPPPSTVTLQQAVDSGQRTVEHLTHLESAGQLRGVCVGDSASLAKCQALANAFRKHNAWITPTMMVWDITGLRISPRLSRLSLSDTTARPTSHTYALKVEAAKEGRVRRFQEIMAMMQKAGMPILAGTDNVGGIHEEMAVLAALGMTRLGALQTATLNPAKYLNATDSLGTVAKGKLADLVLLDADPLADITNTAAIRAVVANGRYYDQAALDQLWTAVQAKKKTAKGSP